MPFVFLLFFSFYFVPFTFFPFVCAIFEHNFSHCQFFFLLNEVQKKKENTIWFLKRKKKFTFFISFSHRISRQPLRLIAFRKSTYTEQFINETEETKYKKKTHKLLNEMKTNFIHLFFLLPIVVVVMCVNSGLWTMPSSFLLNNAYVFKKKIGKQFLEKNNNY